MSEERRCACGHVRSDKQIRAEPRWSVLGSLALFLAGVSARPKEVAFVCDECGTVLEISKDLALRESHRHPS
jgi:hypothetical protein